VNATKRLDLSKPEARLGLTFFAKSADDTSRSKYYIALTDDEAGMVAHTEVTDAHGRKLDCKADPSINV